MNKLVLLLAIFAGCAAARELKSGERRNWDDCPSCKWKCDEDFEKEKWVEKFDCDLEEVYKRNPWHKEKKKAKRGDIFDLPCEAEHKPKKDKKRWHYHGEICQFEADRHFKKGDFCGVFGIEWVVVVELNQDWCENIETDVIIFKKGEIIDVPCHLKHKTKGSKWHWKPQPKRKHKGQVCKWQPDGKHHPRKIARRFDCDYEIIIILNPWIHGRRHCDVEEIIYIPCEKKCDKSEKKWHHDEDKYDCDFERRHPARPHWPKCWNDCCPGDWKPRVWDRDCEEHRWPRFPVVPIWCLPPKPDCGDNVEWICDPSREDGWNGKPVYPEWGTGCYDQCDSNWNWDGHNDWHGKWDFIFGPDGGWWDNGDGPGPVDPPTPSEPECCAADAQCDPSCTNYVTPVDPPTPSEPECCATDAQCDPSCIGYVAPVDPPTPSEPECCANDAQCDPACNGYVAPVDPPTPSEPECCANDAQCDPACNGYVAAVSEDTTSTQAASTDDVTAAKATTATDEAPKETDATAQTDSTDAPEAAADPSSQDA